ncbi:GAF domain-containing protein, partial [Myxococcota bacterium]|nr:GAF domain-containing protein [Myxococcota bacterium]
PPEAHEAEVHPEFFEPEFDRVSELAREICQAAGDEVEPERVIQGILQPLVHHLPAAPVSIFLVGAEGGLALEGECDGGVAGDRNSLSGAKGLTGHVLRTGQLVATAEPDADPRFEKETDTARDGRIRPLLCLPLTLRGRVVGVCRAFLGENRDPSVRMAEVIAPALSAALRNALLYRSLVEAIEDVAQARRAARS